MYEDQIREYIAENPVFLTEELRNALKIPDREKATMNTELARMAKKGTVCRLSKGVYAVPVHSCFGDTPPGEHAVVKHIFIKNGNGYSSGPTFMNQLGLSTWLPRKTHIKSNHYKKRFKMSYFVISAPKTKITSRNWKYLQFLDCIDDMDAYAIDNRDPIRLFREYIRKNGLDMAILLLYAHKHYNRKTEEILYHILETSYESS